MIWYKYSTLAKLLNIVMFLSFMLLPLIDVTKYLLIFILQNLSLLSCYLYPKTIPNLAWCTGAPFADFATFHLTMYIGKNASPVKINAVNLINGTINEHLD